MDEQQAGHRAVLRELIEDRRAGVARAGDHLHDARQPVAVHGDHGGHELLRELAGARVGELVDRGAQLLDAVQELAGNDTGRHGAQLRPVGVCTTLCTRPPPVYMCTPQGRHGSKLRTARMMSTPLKFSGPFSSKIGVFCTASS